MKTEAELLNQKRIEALNGGGKDKNLKQHNKGKLTARERIELFLVENSFNEVGLVVKH